MKQKKGGLSDHKQLKNAFLALEQRINDMELNNRKKAKLQDEAMRDQARNYDRHFAANADDLEEFSNRIDKIINAVNELKYGQIEIEGEIRHISPE